VIRRFLNNFWCFAPFESKIIKLFSIGKKSQKYLNFYLIFQGDSGGPLVIYEEDGLPTEVGINSFVTSFGCESRWPGGLTRVTSFLQWLETNAGVTIRP